MFKRAHRLSLSWARLIQSTFSYSICLRSIYPLRIPSGVFFQVSPPNPVYIALLPHTCHIPSPSHYSLPDHPNNVCEVQIMKLLILQLSPVSCYFLPLSPTQHLTVEHTSAYVLPLLWVTKFHSRKNGRTVLIKCELLLSALKPGGPNFVINTTFNDGHEITQNRSL